MDFAFVPGITDYEKRLQRAMQTRNPKTTLINKNGIATVVDFFQELVSENLNGGDLILGAHASRSAFVMPFDTPSDPANPVRTDYEKVEALSAAGTVHVPASVRSANTSVHLKGCRIGDTALPLLTVIKTALDNPQQVTAPKYLHVLTNDAGQGVFEYMRYAYEVMTPDPKKFDKRADLVAAFQSPPHPFKPFMQGVETGQPQIPVPSDLFEKWVPSQKQLDSLNDEVNLEFTVSLNPPVVRSDPSTGKKVTIAVIWRSAIFTAFPDTFTWKIDMTSQTIPPDKAGRIALLKPSMLTSTLMKFPPAHPFPYYVRYGFPDFETFYSGFDWGDPTVVVENSKQLLKYVGTTFIYRLEIPVVKMGTNQVIFNYYRNSGAAAIHFREDNATYEMFGVV
jgi:hypothetical protein